MGRPITPLLTVDLMLAMGDRIVLIKRANPPYQGQWALPGGFMEVGETVEEAAVREGNEETGLDVELKSLVGVFSDPDRDPRGHTVSICFAALGRGIPQASTDAQDVAMFDLDDLPPLAFDHQHIINTGMGKLRELILQAPH
ncbi:MAG: NUDIX hydrolase [ANME-2 cluster archaeon]|nr:NUDIX hydrolase [ANME-2 cluster archaeon]